MTEPSLLITRLLRKCFPVLWLLYRLEGTVGEAQIASLLEIDLETARNYLRSLVGLGYARREARVNGYEITQLGKDVFAPPNAGIPRIEALTTTTTTELKGNSTETAEAAALPPEFSEKPGKARKASKHKAAHHPGASPIAESSPSEENQAAFREEGIGMNTRVLQLCQEDHVSPEFIHAHAIRLRDEKRFSSSLLIYVVERNDPLPVDRSEEEQNRRYSENAYSEYLND
ncbi:MAG TPA: hypothetical protein VJ436_12460 [Anaerolineales bacterium]|nr:hypothetical protein [Anaerolineales bacterium]